MQLHTTVLGHFAKRRKIAADDRISGYIEISGRGVDPCAVERRGRLRRPHALGRADLLCTRLRHGDHDLKRPVFGIQQWRRVAIVAVINLTDVHLHETAEYRACC